MIVWAFVGVDDDVVVVVCTVNGLTPCKPGERFRNVGVCGCVRLWLMLLLLLLLLMMMLMMLMMFFDDGVLRLNEEVALGVVEARS